MYQLAGWAGKWNAVPLTFNYKALDPFSKDLSLSVGYLVVIVWLPVHNAQCTYTIFGSAMAALPPIDYQQLAQPSLVNVAAAGGAAGAVAGGGAAPAAATAHYSGDHMDIERIESSMKKFLSENCVDTNATVMQNIRTFLDHVSNVFKDQVVLYETRDDMERMAPDAEDTNAFSNMVTRLQKGVQ